MKFKKCCLLKRPLPKLVLDPHPERTIHAEFARIMAAESERTRTFGHVKDIISAKFNGQRLIAIDNEIHHSDKWRTFPDFLVPYLRHCFGSGWGKKELAKPFEARHPVVQWYHHLCASQKQQARGANGIFEFTPDGKSAAFILLGYDLYVLRHHGRLQKETLKRLRRPDSFVGARYELFVAATFIRAGFEIEFEDESNPTKHPEFVARHIETGLTVSVEAKARNRPIGASRSEPRVKRLVRAAAEKVTPHPLIAFIEVDMLPEDRSKPPAWIPCVHQSVLELVLEREPNRLPLDLVVFSNVPHQYGEPGEPDPARHFYAVRPSWSRVPQGLLHLLDRALGQYGTVPNEFPQER